MQWIGLPSLTFITKACEPMDPYARLIVFFLVFLVTSQDCILIIQILVFLKYCVSQIEVIF